VGVPFAGLIVGENSPKSQEYNISFSAPECEAIYTRLKSDLLPILLPPKNLLPPQKKDG
jgi:phosphoribosylamine-glycine ligase